MRMPSDPLQRPAGRGGEEKRRGSRDFPDPVGISLTLQTTPSPKALLLQGEEPGAENKLGKLVLASWAARRLPLPL